MFLVVADTNPVSARMDTELSSMETSRRHERGEDLSLVEFKTLEYQGSKQVVANDEN
jgi:hypothetical protein